MIAEAGHFALLLALALAIVQSCVGLWAGRSRDAALIAMTRSAALGVCAFVVAEGVLQADHSFRADSVLAKHDENYMPREVADALKKQGVWKEGETKGAPAKP